MRELVIGVQHPAGSLFERNLKKAGMEPRDYYKYRRMVFNYAHNKTMSEEVFTLFYQTKEEKDKLIEILADSCKQYNFKPTITEQNITFVNLTPTEE